MARHCGRAACTNDMADMRVDARWCSDACAQRVRRGERAYTAPTKRPGGVQVSYRRAVMAMSIDLSLRGVPMEEAIAAAEASMRYILSDKQRARLDARRDV